MPTEELYNFIGDVTQWHLYYGDDGGEVNVNEFEHTELYCACCVRRTLVGPTLTCLTADNRIIYQT